MQTTESQRIKIMNDQEAVNLFKEILRFRTISGEGPTSGAYHACALFLASQLRSLGFEVSVHEFVQNKPVVIGTMKGKDPSLSSILLNAHYGKFSPCCCVFNNNKKTHVNRRGPSSKR
jgi:acetylornithine deacetylase/succinyl-diaminopimelate desuccinylase-like protein